MTDELREAMAQAVYEAPDSYDAEWDRDIPWEDLPEDCRAGWCDGADAGLSVLFAPENRVALMAELLERGVIEQTKSSRNLTPLYRGARCTVMTDPDPKYLKAMKTAADSSVSGHAMAKDRAAVACAKAAQRLVDEAVRADRERLAAVLSDAKALHDIFIEGGYVEPGDETLLGRLHAALTEENDHGE